MRTLNSSLSTAEGVEVGASPVGSIVTNALKCLEPVDDTVKRIASAVVPLMLLAGVLSVAMAGGLGWAKVALAAPRASIPATVTGTARRAVRFCGAAPSWQWRFPAKLSATAAGWPTAEAWQANQAGIDEITGETTDAARADWTVDTIREKFGHYDNLSGRIYDRAGELVQSYVALFSNFIFNLFVLPLLLAGGFLDIVRSLTRGRD